MKMMRGDMLRLLIGLAAIALVLAAGLCLFDPDEAHAAGVDLCVSVAVVAGIPLLPIFLASAGRLAPARVSTVRLTSRAPLAPPPKG